MELFTDCIKLQNRSGNVTLTSSEPTCAVCKQSRFFLLLFLFTDCSILNTWDPLNSTQGTVCLDGSPPAYYLRSGYGTGANKWVIYLKGGGWCLDLEECYERTKTEKGTSSSKFWPDTMELNGLLSDNKTVNTDFYNWNVVFVIYCDGASFSNFL